MTTSRQVSGINMKLARPFCVPLGKIGQTPSDQSRYQPYLPSREKLKAQLDSVTTHREESRRDS